jgi:hypothetical protein
METKCITCNIFKTSENFFNKYVCYDCINDNNGEICCGKCKIIKNKKEFYRKKCNKLGIDNNCKKCRKPIYIPKEKPEIPPQIKNVFVDEKYNKYKEFIEKFLVKTECKNDKIFIAKLLFKYKKFMSNNYKIKYSPILNFFKEKMEEQLGKYEGSKIGFKGYNYVDEL